MDEELASPATTGGLQIDDLVDQLPAPVVVHRPGGDIVYANTAMAELVGLPDRHAIEGRQLTEFVHHDDLAESLPLIAKLDGFANRWTSLRLVRSGGGPPIHVDIHQIPVVFDGDTAALSVVADVTDRIAAEQALRRSEARFRALVQNASDMVVVHQNGVFTYVSDALTRILGWESAELVGRPVASIVHDDDQDELRRRMDQRQDGVVSDGPGRYRLRCKNGTWRTVETISTSHSDDPEVQGVVVNARDVTTAIEAETAMRASEARHRALVEHLSDVIVVADAEGRIDYASPGIVEVVGWPVDDVVGQTIFDAIHPDDEEAARQQLRRAIVGGPGRYGPERFRYLRADGAWRHLEATGSNRLDDPAVGGFVFILRDVTEQFEAQEQLRHLALHDALTGIANRTLLTERLLAALDAGRRQRAGTALLVIDLDGFKAVNDDHGHATGDAVLVELAARLRATTRTADTVGRSGGDEFAAVLSDATDAEGAARRMAAAIREPIRHDGVELRVGASIGVAVAPGHGETVDALFRRADAAMYLAKSEGIDVVLYEPGMDGPP